MNEMNLPELFAIVFISVFIGYVLSKITNRK